jgi:predicted alpha/beta-fold hydrolase
MPIISDISYRAPFWQWNGHVQSIYPSMFRKIHFQYDHRERLELADGDFVDLDWHQQNTTHKKLVIITHGLEGDSGRHYVTGMAKKFVSNGWDALGWNCRSCSGEPNRLLRFYHHGDANDLRAVIQHAINKYGYENIVLVGFSMGGSLSLRSVGEFPDQVPVAVKKVIGISVPCDLYASVQALSQPGNSVYVKRFLKKLGKKIKEKSIRYPDQISYAGYEKINNFIEFDNRFTAPLHGYKDAIDFYARASVKPLLTQIKIPVLLIQALNDPFLSPECIGYEAANSNPNILLETTSAGGHCGFMLSGTKETYPERRAIHFANS